MRPGSPSAVSRGATVAEDSYSLAGELGPASELFSGLPAEERLAELNDLVVTLQGQVDMEAETQGELERQLDGARGRSEADRLRANIAASDRAIAGLVTNVQSTLP